MSEELEDIVDNLREPNAWLRILFMVAFALALYLAIAPVLLILMLAQALFTIITGDDNDNLRGFGSALSQYIYQILNFLTFNTDEKPFPFSDLPNGSVEAKAESAAKKSPAKKKAAPKAPKKRAAKKKTSVDEKEAKTPDAS